jgi:hypothetical protein
MNHERRYSSKYSSFNGIPLGSSRYDNKLGLVLCDEQGQPILVAGQPVPDRIEKEQESAS